MVGHLPPKQREVFAMTFDGYEPSEIAELTGDNPATVRSNLRAARKGISAAAQQALSSRQQGREG